MSFSNIAKGIYVRVLSIERAIFESIAKGISSKIPLQASESALKAAAKGGFSAKELIALNDCKVYIMQCKGFAIPLQCLGLPREDKMIRLLQQGGRQCLSLTRFWSTQGTREICG